METFAIIAGAIAAVWKIVDATKMQFPKLPGIAVQAEAWVLGIGLAFVLRESDLAAAVAIGDTVLFDRDGWTTVLVGIGLGSSSSVSVDLVKSIDQYRTSAPGAPDPVVPVPAALPPHGASDLTGNAPCA